MQPFEHFLQGNDKHVVFSMNFCLFVHNYSFDARVIFKIF
jgi:hypothetical protein